MTETEIFEIKELEKNNFNQLLPKELLNEINEEVKNLKSTILNELNEYREKKINSEENLFPILRKVKKAIDLSYKFDSNTKKEIVKLLYTIMTESDTSYDIQTKISEYLVKILK
jgi:hypothetical protein